ncbi:NitT/TauT family transport system permease protein [Streptomyces sp. SAI-133]|uniref:ABC transporter permease n=1 Tax=unclassified Streptomyces TaxID=2593676 RepID=UPI002476B4DB|nr:MULTISPECIES: ABC transporter permease subunit [unclassified Streptomyces]MDH6554511.1 NitT/TauT family transport system permease protein [Streptomyces sp. SAI-041]MDH6581492.1 NitT/TauT family transport system permease protein [Streptomyces sp. SAI-133]
MRAGRRGAPGYLRLDRARAGGLPAWAWRTIIVAAALGAVELTARFALDGSYELVPITTMAQRAAELLVDPGFLTQHLLWSSVSVLVSFTAAAVIGIALGYLMHGHPWWNRALRPYLSVFYAVPIFALYPLLVVVFGTGLMPILLIATAFSAVVVTTHASLGFASVPQNVDKLATAVRTSRSQYVRLVLFPAALPDIVAGARLGFAYSITAVLASEFILSTRGVGHFISTAYAGFMSVDMYAGIFLVAAFSLVLIAVVDRAAAHLDWRSR